MKQINLKELKGKTILFLDIETTGLDKSKNTVIEIAGIKVNPDGTRVEFEELCKADKLSPLIVSLTGITDDMLASARQESEVLSDFSTQMISNADVIVTHNGLRFDVPFLRARYSTFFKPASPGVVYIDTLPLSQIAYPLADSHKLSSLADAMGIPTPAAHRALGDVLTLERVFNKLTDVDPIEKEVFSDYEEKLKALDKAKKELAESEEKLVAELQGKGGYLLMGSGEAIGFVPEHTKQRFDTSRFQKENDETIVSLYQKTVFDAQKVKDKSPSLYKKFLKTDKVPVSVNKRKYTSGKF